MGTCKWCGGTFPLEQLQRFGGFCCPAHLAAGRQKERIYLGIGQPIIKVW